MNYQLTADGVYIYRNTTAYLGEGRGNWGTLVADVTDDSDYKDAYEWFEDDNAGGLLTNGTVYHYKAFPYVGGVINETQGANELYCRAGLLEHEWVPSDLSGSSVPDRAGSNNLTIVNMTLNPGGGKVGDSLLGSSGYAVLASQIPFVTKSIFVWINLLAQGNGVFGYSTDTYNRGSYIGGTSILVAGAGNEYYANANLSTGWHMIGVYYGADSTTANIKLYSDNTKVYDGSPTVTYGNREMVNRLLYANIPATQLFHKTDADAVRIFSDYPTQNELDMLYNGGVGC